MNVYKLCLTILWSLMFGCLDEAPQVRPGPRLDMYDLTTDVRPPLSTPNSSGSGAYGSGSSAYGSGTYGGSENGTEEETPARLDSDGGTDLDAGVDEFDAESLAPSEDFENAIDAAIIDAQ